LETGREHAHFQLGADGLVGFLKSDTIHINLPKSITYHVEALDFVGSIDFRFELK
jgi:hypothetical protein